MLWAAEYSLSAHTVRNNSENHMAPKASAIYQIIGFFVMKVYLGISTFKIVGS